MLTIVFYFIISTIMAAQATHPVGCNFGHRLLNYVLGLISFSLAVGFAIKLTGVETIANENILGLMIIAALPPMLGIWIGVWADKQGVGSKAGDTASGAEKVG